MDRRQFIVYTAAVPLMSYVSLTPELWPENDPRFHEKSNCAGKWIPAVALHKPYTPHLPGLVVKTCDVCRTSLIYKERPANA